MSANFAAPNLSAIARETFDAAQSSVDARQAVARAVKLDGERLSVESQTFDLQKSTEIYSVALGKAARKMAVALTEILRDKLTGGVISAPDFAPELPAAWQQFRGGHPIPNQSSLDAAAAAFRLLDKANKPEAIVIFLVSGGGSAMLEMPANASVSLADLQTANRILIGCGARIGDINALRKRFSAVKNGGLSRAARFARQATLIISDTNAGEAFNVASGPTIESENDLSASEFAELVERYNLREKLPKTVYERLQQSFAADSPENRNPKTEVRNWTVLLENSTAIAAAEHALRARGFAVETATDLVETEIDAGCRQLVERLIALRARVAADVPTAVLSGGEFACPVRGGGTGGRSLESALRTAILFDELRQRGDFRNTDFVALFAGTDGIDGNSPAAGAWVDGEILQRAREQALNAHKFLNNSDSYTFLRALDQTIETGATGTNVRDARILLAF